MKTQSLGKEATRVELCLGIDPQAEQGSFEAWQQALSQHEAVLDRIPYRLKLKPNLSFFLRHGSKGIAALEEFCDRYRERFDLIVDAKFNEIANSLNAQLDFVFGTLGASGVTINPFLGEKTLTHALERAVTACGDRARVYVLCATSEYSASHLAAVQQPSAILKACADIRARVLGTQHPDAMGVVVGANRSDVLLSTELAESGLAVLAPGLGAQGANEDVVLKLLQSKRSQEFSFPMSRGIFKGGTLEADDAFLNYQTQARLFLS